MQISGKLHDITKMTIILFNFCYMWLGEADGQRVTFKREKGL